MSDFINVSIKNLTNAECGDLAVTAAEGGINYWAAADGYDWTRWTAEDGISANPNIPDDFVFYTIWDKEDNTLPKTAVTPETFRRGMELLMDKYRDTMVARWFIQNNRDEWDCADADAVDAIIQLGIFGDIIYG